MADQATLDLIQKLLRLATHNPSEAEATAAAVKVCQLMAEHDVLGGNGALDWEQLRDDVLRVTPIVPPRQKAAARTHAPTQPRPKEGSYASHINGSNFEAAVANRLRAEREGFMAQMLVTQSRLDESETERARLWARNRELHLGLGAAQAERDELRKLYVEAEGRRPLFTAERAMAAISLGLVISFILWLAS